LGVSDEEFAKGILRFCDPIRLKMLIGPMEQQEPVPDPSPASKLVPRKKNETQREQARAS